MTNDVLQMLIAERDKLNRAIEALQSEPGRGKGWRRRMFAAPGSSRTRKRRGMSAEARKAQSERMKAYWAARRRQRGRAAS